MTRKITSDDGIEHYLCERCDCVVALVDTNKSRPNLREGSYITDQPEPRDGCECPCHATYRLMRRFPQ